MDLKSMLDGVKGLDQKAMEAATDKLKGLIKPFGSLGVLEEIVVKLAGISGTALVKADNKAVAVLCADNGVADEDVSQAPKALTPIITKAAADGFAGINALSAYAGAKVFVYNFGVEGDINSNRVIDKSIRAGTWNIKNGPAMTRDEAYDAILKGIEIIKEMKEAGIHIAATGEMGIGNTTTSSAISAVLTGCKVEDMVGKGSGVIGERLENKRRVVKKAIEVNNPDPENPVDVLAKLGGFDIAGLTGCFLGAAIYRMPILIDGFISSIAALAAVRILPVSRDFMITSHASAEPGSVIIMKALGLEPMLNMKMRLGEGTGAALAFLIVDASLAAYYNMGTFEDIGLNTSVLE